MFTAMPGDQAAPAAASPLLALDLGDGDVWSWRKSITGSCQGLSPDTGIDVVVNDRRYEATRQDDAFTAEVRLEPGRSEIYAKVDSDEPFARSATVTLTGRLSPRPVARLDVTIKGEDLHLDGSASNPGDDDGAPITAWSWTLAAAAPEPQPVLATAAGTTCTLPLPALDGRYRVSLSVIDDQRRSDSAAVIVEVSGGRAHLPDPFRDKPAWTAGATVYGVVVRNFGPNGFQSVTDRLDDLADLGIAALWLAPINVSPPGDFGYAIVDYFNVRPEYGTLADVRRLVDEAHARGIRVLMDVVPNHTSSEHPYFQDAGAGRNGTVSPYGNFYERGRGEHPDHYFSWTHLPNLNVENPDVRRFITEALMYWAREMDVDGFRIDVAWGIRERRPEFWPEFCREFYRVKPDGLLIAEASARDSYYVNNGFGAAYDWIDDLGVWAWTDAFSGELPDLAALRRALVNAEGGGFDPNSFTLRFLNNNDTGPRFVTTHGVEMYRVALAMLMTLPGLPCIYTGDEAGAQFEPYATPGPIGWTDDHGLRPFHYQLIHLRRTHPALRTREWTLLEADPSDQVLAYLRPAPGGASPLLVVLNFGPHELEARVAKDELRIWDRHEIWSELLGDEWIASGGGDELTIALPPWGIRFLVPGSPPVQSNSTDGIR